MKEKTDAFKNQHGMYVAMKVHIDETQAFNALPGNEQDIPLNYYKLKKREVINNFGRGKVIY